MADKALNLYNGVAASPPPETWVSLFTSAPTSDIPTGHGGVEWGPARKQIHRNSTGLAPRWSLPAAANPTEQQIQNVGAVQWLSISLTVSPSIVIAFGIWDAPSGGNLLTWDFLDAPVTVTDAENRVFGTGDLKVKAD